MDLIVATGGRPTRRGDEDARAVGGLRSPHLSSRATLGAAAIGAKIAGIIDEVIHRNEEALTAALQTLGQKHGPLPMFDAAQACRRRIAEELAAAIDGRHGPLAPSDLDP